MALTLDVDGKLCHLGVPEETIVSSESVKPHKHLDQPLAAGYSTAKAAYDVDDRC